MRAAILVHFVSSPSCGEDGTDPGGRQDDEHGSQENLPGPRVRELRDEPLAGCCNVERELLRWKMEIVLCIWGKIDCQLILIDL